MRRQIKYVKLPYQREFHDGKKFYDALFAGFGGGKTYSLCMKMFQLAEANRGLPGGILSPNLKMFKRDVLPTVREICDTFRIPFKYHKQESVLELFDTQNVIYIFHSEDDGFSIKGPNLAFGLINEVTLCSKGAFEAFISRIRLKRARFRQVAMSGTPEGFNWVYDFFVKKPRQDADLIFGDMRLNRFVASEYAKMLTDSYDDQLAQQYVEGKFINVNALSALYKFNRAKHVGKVERIAGMPIWISCDFNRTPMTATIYNKMPDNEPHRLRGFAEIKINKSDTHELVREIRNKIGNRFDQEVVIFPDPAGKHADTRSGTTDIEILESSFKDVRFRNSIKSIRDCLNAANAFLKKDYVILDSEGCENTIIDFEQTSIKPGTNELDKSNKERTHFVDGFKNMIEYEFPITIKEGGWKQVAIR